MVLGPKKCRDCGKWFPANFDWQVTCHECSSKLEKAFLPPQSTLLATTLTQPLYYTKKWEEERDELIVRYNEADIAAIANVVKEFRENMGLEPKIKVKKVIFDYPATIVYWYDNTKTVVKCRKGEHFDMETGLAMAFCKKLLGDKYKSRFRKIIKGAVIKHTEPEVSNTDKLSKALKDVLDDIDNKAAETASHNEPDPMGSGAGEVKDEYPDGGF